jgi:hypothetical protein
MADRLMFSVYLSRVQAQYEQLIPKSSRVHEPVSDHAENFGIRFICVIKARRVHQNNRMAVGGMGNSDGSNGCCPGLQAMTNGFAILTSGLLDYL